MVYMKDVERASKTFDSIAEHFDLTRDRPWDEVTEFLRNIEGTIIDLGCGNGRHSLVAKELGLEFVCLDASKRLLDIAKKKTDSYGFYVRSGLKKLPFKNCSFDHAIYIAAIHHLSEGRIDSLREVRRILKNNGKVIVSSWARELDRWELDEDEDEIIVPWHKQDGKVVDRFYHLYRLDGLAHDVDQSGLKILKKFRSGGNNYVIAKKD